MVRVKIASYDVREPAYFRFFLKNATQFIVGYHACPVVVEVAMDGVGNDIEFLVFPRWSSCRAPVSCPSSS